MFWCVTKRVNSGNWKAKVRQIFWGMRLYCRRCGQAPVEGGNLNLLLQKEGRYEELLALYQSDIDNLSAMIPEDKKEDD